MSLKEKIKIPKYTLGEEIFSSISHGVGALLSIAALVLCVVFSALHKNAYAVVASAIYGSTSIILYVMSTLYHAFKINNAKRVLRIIDHCSIFLLIAGTYTPYALVALPKTLGWVIFSINWGCAVIGIILNSIDLERYKKISIVLYLLMGWMIIFSYDSLIASVPFGGLCFMFIAGFLYTFGIIIYAVGKKIKYMHSIFHLFTLAASICFFFSIFFYVI